MVNTATYLNLYDLFVNQIAGNVVLFIFLSFAVIAFFAEKFKFPNMVTLTMFIVFAIMVSVVSQSLLIIVSLVVGLFLAWGFSRLFTRG